MVTRVTWELTSEERRKLARDLLPEILSELEAALFTLREQETAQADPAKAQFHEALLEFLWELEPHLSDPDEGKTLLPDIEEQLRRTESEPRISFEDVKRRIDG